jgi:hypothetical protein
MRDKRTMVMPALPADPRLRLATLTLLIVGALTLANLIFNLVEIGLGRGFPYSTFLSDPIDNFGDFFSLLSSYPHGETAVLTDRIGLHALLPVNSPSLHVMSVDGLEPVTNFHLTPFSSVAAMVMLALTRWFDPMIEFLLLNACLAIYMAAIAFRTASSRGEALTWAAIGTFSYPMLIAAARGNLHAGLTGLLLIDALLLGLSRRAPIKAAFLLAVACNVRPNAILFALPLLAWYWPQRWRFSIALGTFGLAILGASAVAAHALYPAYTLASFRAGLKAYYKLYAVHYFGMAYGSTLYGALKVAVDGWRPGLDKVAMLVSLMIALGGYALYLLRRIGDVGLIFLIMAGYTLGSTVLADYHLVIFLCIPIALAAESTRRDSEDARRIMFIAACLMLTPKNYVFWAERLSLQVVFNPMVLLCVSLAVIAGSLQRDRAGISRSAPLPA